MFLLFLLTLGNITISGSHFLNLRFSEIQKKKDMKNFVFLFYFDLFKVDLSPFFQLHMSFYQLVVLSIWFSKPFSSNLLSYQAIVRQLACLRKFQFYNLPVYFPKQNMVERLIDTNKLSFLYLFSPWVLVNKRCLEFSGHQSYCCRLQSLIHPLYPVSRFIVIMVAEVQYIVTNMLSMACDKFGCFSQIIYTFSYMGFV